MIPFGLRSVAFKLHTPSLIRIESSSHPAKLFTLVQFPLQLHNVNTNISVEISNFPFHSSVFQK